MKILVVSIILIVSQSLMAKIADFNVIIEEHSKAQSELYESFKKEISEDLKENQSVENDKKTEIIALETNYESFQKPKTQKKKNHKKTLKIKNNYQSQNNAIEEKHFRHLGEELSEAQ